MVLRVITLTALLVTFRVSCSVDDVKCILVMCVCVSVNSVYLCVCLSLAAFSHYCTDPDVTFG